MMRRYDLRPLWRALGRAALALLLFPVFVVAALLKD